MIELKEKSFPFMCYVVDYDYFLIKEVQIVNGDDLGSAGLFLGGYVRQDRLFETKKDAIQAVLERLRRAKATVSETMERLEKIEERLSIGELYYD